ncbi:NACHT, LRR and PYD domains-containing protein 10-like [Homarus americanus]|uniref:NACHT, LRR and PYD domains-containing protein 10-like n=1 Tax=Homarus americanus TaxID=6706 RepID=UPI001C4744E3|nr:NACHT, LRR and PYD domains-containing protein 10-like [Homarus americanus]
MSKFKQLHSYQIGEEELHVFRLSSVINSSGKDTLCKIFQWGCQKPEGMSLREYLVNCKGMPTKIFQRNFNKAQIHKIETDHTGKTYDITLLFICIQLACANLAPKHDPIWLTHDDSRLESIINDLKQLRNIVFHSHLQNMTQNEMVKKMEELRNLLTNSLKVAGSLYQQPCEEIEEHIRHINDLINETRDSPLSPAALQWHSKNNGIAIDHMKMILSDSGTSELRRIYEMESQVDPVTLLTGGKSLEISSIFTKIEMVYDTRQKISMEPNYENILDIRNSVGKKPSIILVEGVAGTGKTTLCKLLLSDWSKHSNLISGLDQCDLLFHIRCRDSTITSFMEFLLSRLPKTSLHFKDEDLIKSVLSLKVLVIVDGLDELNSSSKRLVNELLHKHFKGNTENLRMICTTRPESISVLYKMVPSGVELCHLKLAGISKDRMTEFVTKLDQGMKRSGMSTKDTEGLINFLRTSPRLSEHFRLPLNLVLMTYLWVAHPNAVKWLTSATSLYTTYMKFTQEKLIERLNRKKQDLCVESIEKRYTEFLEALYRESLLALQKDKLSLERESIDHLVDVCRKLHLPSAELFSATLTHRESYTQSEYSERFSFPHKGIQDFYSALYILTTLTKTDVEKTIENITRGIKKALETRYISADVCTDIIKFAENRISAALSKPKSIYEVIEELNQEEQEELHLNKYQNILMHLAGLLTKKSNMLEKYAEEIVNFLVKSGVRNPEQWLNVLTEAECNPVLAEHISKVIFKDRWKVRDGNIQAASALLKFVKVENIELDISNDPQSLPGFVELLHQVSQFECVIQLYLHHHWRHIEMDCSDDFLNHLKVQQHHTGLQVTKIMVSVKNISVLFPTLDILYLGIGKEYVENTVDSPDYLTTRMTKLQFLYLHVLARVPLEVLPQLPKKMLMVDLWFSSVKDEDVEWVGKATLKLQGVKIIFWSIRFPRSELTVNGCKLLATHLEGVRLGMSGVQVSSSRIKAVEVEELNPIFLMKLRSTLKLISEADIWEL